MTGVNGVWQDVATGGYELLRVSCLIAMTAWLTGGKRACAGVIVDCFAFRALTLAMTGGFTWFLMVYLFLLTSVLMGMSLQLGRMTGSNPKSLSMIKAAVIS